MQKSLQRPASLWVPCIADVWENAPEVYNELLADIESFVALLPFKVIEIEAVGSSVRDDWWSHSDLDICLATGDGWRDAKRLWVERKDQTVIALRLLKGLWHKWGMMIQVSLESPSIKQNEPEKSVFCMRERVHYRPEKKERVVSTNGATFPRFPMQRVRPPMFTFSYFDENFEMQINKSPETPEEIAKWKRRHGARFLPIGDTPDTTYLKNK